MLQIRAVILKLLTIVALADGANILAILPIGVKSHYVVMEPLLHALAARGHHLTVYSSFPQRQSVANITDIDCSEGRRICINNFEFDTMKLLAGNAIRGVNHVINFMRNDCEEVYTKSPLKHFNRTSQVYDLLITEMFSSDCFVHFAYKLGVPLVSIVTSVPYPWTPDKFGLPDNSAYIPTNLFGFPPLMTFFNRLINTLILHYAKLRFHFYSNFETQKLAEEYFQERLPWVGDVAGNSSLLLVNSHFSLSHSRPLPPNVVEIGGIHIREAQPLPKDIENILDKSPQGVILFSFGSMVRLSSFPKDIIKTIFSVLSQLPQTVIMKNEEDFPDLPKNVIVRNWLPQRDILSHKNVVACVTHGGLASVMEAIYTATPLLGIPLFSDQFFNINNVVVRGGGVQVDLDTIDEQQFKHAIHEVINNPKIVEGMKRLSAEFRDRPQSALQSAVYWTEYVLRHKGAPHLRPASTSLSLYQLWLLDVLAVLLAALAAVFYTIYYISKYFISITISTNNSAAKLLKKMN